MEERVYPALAGTGHVAAVDLGGTKILAALVSPEGRIVARVKRSTGKGGVDVLDRIADAVQRVARDCGVALNEVGALGVGVPGPVSLESGVVAVAVNIPGWKDIGVRDELRRRLAIPVVVDNDVRVAVMAEHAAGAGAGARHMLGLWPGTGIGGGIIIDGQIVRGATNTAGEIGHMTLKAGGARCNCGGTGHLESLGSRTAIVRRISRAIKSGHRSSLSKVKGGAENARSADLASAYRSGDRVVVAAVDRAIDYLALGIASLANVVNPERVVMGGGLIEAFGATIVDRVNERVKLHPMYAATAHILVVPSALADDAGIVGASLIARRLADQAAAAA